MNVSANVDINHGHKLDTRSNVWYNAATVRPMALSRMVRYCLPFGISYSFVQHPSCFSQCVERSFANSNSLYMYIFPSLLPA